MRVVVPLVKRIQASNATDQLRVVSLTGLIGSDTEDTPLEKAQELGIAHAVALSAMFGEWTPYLNLNKSPALTFAFVVGRSGGVLWKGDPSRETEDFLEAVREALAAPKARPLPPAVDAELADAAAAYVRHDFAKARKLAVKAAARYQKKQGEEAQRIATEAAGLIGLVDGTEQDLGAALDAAWEAREAGAFADAARALSATFPKSAAAGAVRGRLAEDPDFAAAVEAWSSWGALRDARPPAFPERDGKLEARYAKSLDKYLGGNGDGPGAEQARAWLERYRAER